MAGSKLACPIEEHALFQRAIVLGLYPVRNAVVGMSETFPLKDDSLTR